jgi:hypothetical protein
MLTLLVEEWKEMIWEYTEDAYCQSRHLDFGGDSQSGSAIESKF